LETCQPQPLAGDLQLDFRVAMDNEKTDRNPAARIRRKTETNGKVRFPSDAEERDLLKAIDRLPAVSLTYPAGHPYRDEDDGTVLASVNQVDTERRQIHLPKTKNRHPRVVRLNSVAVSALESLGPEKHRAEIQSSCRLRPT
jgi:hypothetical protein